MTAATKPHDVELPVGASAEPDAWQFWDNECRVIHGRTRTTTDFALRVDTSAQQRRDGSIDTSELAAPRVWVNNLCAVDGLTAMQARQLAVLLVEAADEVDGWAAR